MKYYSIFAEIIFTIIVAGALGFIASLLAYAILQLFNLSGDQLLQEASHYGSVVFGIVIGYRLNDVIRYRKKTTK